MTKIIRAFPPNWIDIAKVFPIKGRQGIVYAYGDRIYNPSGITIEPWILDHETEHCKRQNEMGTGAWWDAYILNTKFRLKEEVLAHRAEYASYRMGHSQKATYDYLRWMAHRLASPIYGHMVPEDEAKRLITEFNDAIHYAA